MNHPLIDHHQNFWDLTCIQVASVGIPGIVLGWQIANQYGVGNAIGAICIGNLILWVLEFVTVSMSIQDRSNAITNVKKYLGKWSAIVAAMSIMVAFLIWYIIQLKVSVDAFDQVFHIDGQIADRTLRIGAALGLWAALLAIGGIRMVKWTNVICMPILILALFYAWIISPNPRPLSEYWGVSIPAISFIVLFNFLEAVILPTFFRFSRSVADSYVALTLIALLNTLIQIATIWIGFNQLTPLLQQSNIIIQFSIIAFIVLVTLSSLLQNIYVASSSWESIFPFEGKKEYAIIGLAGTAAYIFIQISSPMIFLVDVATNFILNLAVVLVITFLAQLIIKRRPVTFGRLAGSATWLVGCITTAILRFQFPDQMLIGLCISIGISTLMFLSIIFVEETLWSIQKIAARSE